MSGCSSRLEPAPVHALSTRRVYPVAVAPRRHTYDLSPAGDLTLSPRNRLLLDIALFAAFVVASNPLWTGITLHAWFSAILLAPVLYHIAINWDWVWRTADRIFEKLKAASRVNFFLDVVLFVATVTLMLSGIVVLPGVLVPDPNSLVDDVWRGVHAMSSDTVLVLLVVHLLLHAKWMWEAAVRGIAGNAR